MKSKQKLVHETCTQAKSTFMTVISCGTHNNIFAVRIMHQHNTLKRRGTQFLIDCKINSILWSHSFISCQCWVVYQQSHITIQSNLKWLERKRWIIPYFWFPWRSSFEISEFLSPQRKRGGKSLHLNATPGETCTSRQLFHINCTETKTIRDQQCEKHADIRLQNQDDKDEDEAPVKSWRYVRLFFHL